MFHLGHLSPAAYPTTVTFQAALLRGILLVHGALAEFFATFPPNWHDNMQVKQKWQDIAQVRTHLRDILPKETHLIDIAPT